MGFFLQQQETRRSNKILKFEVKKPHNFDRNLKKNSMIFWHLPSSFPSIDETLKNWILVLRRSESAKIINFILIN